MPDIDDQAASRAGVGATPGTILRDRRMERGLSLAEVSKRLHLSTDQIQALEQDQYDRLPGPVFVRGFIRKYARLLGLDAEDLTSRLGWKGESSNQGSTQRLVPKAEGPLMEHNWRTVLWTLVAVLVLVGVVVIAYQQTEPQLDTLALDPGNTPKPGRTALSPPASQSQPAATTSAMPTAPAGSIAGQGGIAPTISLPQAAASATLQLQMTDEVWVEIKDATGKSLFKRLGHAGEQDKLQGQPPFRVVLGNAAAVQVWFNGAPFTVPGGRPGQVVRFVVDETALQQQASDSKVKKHP